jgi:hypothetical protein
MVTDKQVRRLMMLINKEKTQAIAASKAGMDEKTARKYLKLGQLPSQLKKDHTWQTRTDPFEGVWDEVLPFLKENPGLEAGTLFSYLQRQYPGRFEDGQKRTFQRKVKRWKALEGEGKEVYFPQVHHPGDLSCSDFTHMDDLGVTINGIAFSHLMFHFVLTYSNWETVTTCFSENFESLSRGFQNAFWQLGGVSRRHRTDNLSAAVYRDLSKKEFTPRYKSLLKHYKLEGTVINAGCANENGDVEQSHYRFKKAVDQALMLRGSRDFESRQQYERFIAKIFKQLNTGRSERFLEELKHLRQLPEIRLDDFRKLRVKVRPGSTISLRPNVYSVHSRLIGEWVEARLYSDFVEVWYAQRMIDRFVRLRGENRHHIQYRHIIDWLVRKPGAFENYRYRDDLFPCTTFRMAYDWLKQNHPAKASKEYLQILYLAAKGIESEVEHALRTLFYKGEIISSDAVKVLLNSQQAEGSWLVQDVCVKDVDLSDYDELLFVSANENEEMEYGSSHQ